MMNVIQQGIGAVNIFLKGSIMKYSLETKNTLLGYLRDAQRAAMNNDLDYFRELAVCGLCSYVRERSCHFSPNPNNLFESTLDIFSKINRLDCNFPVEGGKIAYYYSPPDTPHYTDYFWDTSTPYGKARLDFVTDFIKWVENFDISNLKEKCV